MIRTAGAAIVVIASCAVFWATAFPSITWWDSSSYSLAAATLGISSAPGSLLLMLIGWPIAHLPFGESPAHRLNLLAGFIAALTAAMVCVIAIRLLFDLKLSEKRPRNTANESPSVAIIAGAISGALVFVFAGTVWEYSVMFTPYILTALFTSLILYSLIRWWTVADYVDSSWWLALIALLFGLDFSVHRTNALLIPGALLFVLIRKPRVFLSPRVIFSSVVALAAGLSVQLLLIPIARVTRSDLNFGNPRDFARFWDYVALANSGHDLKMFDRNASLLDVQIPHFLRALSDNALSVSGIAGAAGALPAVLACIGLIAIFRRQTRLAIALIVLLSMQAAMTVFFFNIPANYFRSLDRHYLPVWVTVGVLIATGGGAVVEAASSWSRAVLVPALASLVALVVFPGVQLLNNWKSHDQSRNHFAHDFARNLLNGLPPESILFTVGDNDTFPLMYMQGAERMRPDVRVVNLSVVNYDDYADQRLANDPEFPITLNSAARRALRDKPWRDSVVTLRFGESNSFYDLEPDAPRDTVATFTITPKWDARMTLGEITLLDIIRTNAWKRPVTFATTGSRQAMTWLEPYGRLDGIYWRIVPVKNPNSSEAVIQRNIFSTYVYRGYADSTIAIDEVSARMGAMYFETLSALAAGQMARGDTTACTNDVRKLITAIPPARVIIEPQLPAPEIPSCRARD